MSATEIRYSLDTEVLDVCFARLGTFLYEPAADWIVDAVTCGEMIDYEVDELLSDFGIEPTRVNKRRFFCIGRNRIERRMLKCLARTTLPLPTFSLAS